MRRRTDITALQRDVGLFKETVAKFAGLLAGRSFDVVFRGASAATSADHMVLPSVDALESLAPSHHAKAQRFIETMLGYVHHEVGHIVYSDFKAWERLLRGQPKQVRALANVVEDAFVERQMLALWPGSGGHVERAMRNTVDAAKPYYATKDAFTQICYLFDLLCRGPQYHDAFEFFDPDLVKWARTELRKHVKAVRKVQSTTEAIQLGKKLHKIILKAFEPPPVPTPVKQEDEDEEEADEQDTEEDGEEEADEQGTEEDGQGDSSGNLEGKNDGSASDEQKTACQEIDNREALSASYRQLLQVAAQTQKPAYAVYTTEGDYIGPMMRECVDDWGVWYGWFKKTCNWQKPPNLTQTGAYIQGLAEQTGGPLRTALARVLKARGSAYEVRDLDQGKLDRRRLWKVAVENNNHNPRVRKQRFSGQTHNIAVLIAINESQSMGLPVAGGQLLAEPASRPAGFSDITRMDMAAAAGLALGDVLHALHMSFGILGHTTGGKAGDFEVGAHRHAEALKKDCNLTKVFTRYGDINIEWVKQFGENWLSRRRYIGGLYFQGNTYDAEVVRYAHKVLTQQTGVTRRVLIMLDDGDPCPDLRDIYGRVHRRVLREEVQHAQEGDTEILGVGMGCDVSEYYDHHVKVDDLSQLPQILLNKFGEMLGVKR
jgi:Cobalamin biosynthesis protein CobT VWA domain/Cobalamin biosynthesis protein CobT